MPATACLGQRILIFFPHLPAARPGPTVEMRDGESFAIAGLLNRMFYRHLHTIATGSATCCIGRVCFRSAKLPTQPNRAVIIITHTLCPDRGEALALPTDRSSAHESELFCLAALPNRQQRPPTKGAAFASCQQDFSGSYGLCIGFDQMTSAIASTRQNHRVCASLFGHDCYRLCTA